LKTYPQPNSGKKPSAPKPLQLLNTTVNVIDKFTKASSIAFTTAKYSCKIVIRDSMATPFIYIKKQKKETL